MAEADTEAVRGGTEVPCSDVDSTPEGLQKLCETLIACRCLAVLAMNDRACVYYKNDSMMDVVRINHPYIWSFRVLIFGVEVKVSKPRRLWRLIHSRYKMEQEVSDARSLMEAIKRACKVVKKEIPRSEDGREVLR